MDTSNEASPRTQIIAPILSLDPEELGRKVREIWIAWAKEQPNPKTSWLKPWEELSEPDKEVDRRIGMQIAVGVVARLRRNLDNAREAHDMQLAAIMTATFQNTVSTIKDRIGRDNPYWTVAYDDVCRSVDREMKERDAKNAAYSERNRLVAALARCFPSGVAKTAIEGWSEDWHNCVYIDLPTGQASWHFHDSEAHLFAGLPPYLGKWDGHTTEEKYERVAKLMSGQASVLK